MDYVAAPRHMNASSLGGAVPIEVEKGGRTLVLWKRFHFDTAQLGGLLTIISGEERILAMSQQSMQSGESMLKKSLDERRAILAQQIQMAVARGGRVESQGDSMAVVVYGKPVNHILHLLLTILTAGFWIIVWIILVVSGGEKRWMITVDESGNVLNQQVHGPVAIPTTIVVSPVAASAPSAPVSGSTSDKLTELKKMFDQGLITEAEYNEKRAKLLEQM